MKIHEWIDKNGYKRRAMLRDKDSADMAEFGIPMDPPDVNLIDWDGVKRDLHNALVDAKIVTWDDVVHVRDGIAKSILTATKRPVVQLYKIERRDGVKHGNL